jgi:hypothetical protein
MVLPLEGRELRRPSHEREAHPVGIVRHGLQVDRHAPVRIDPIGEEPDETGDRLGQLLAIDLDDQAFLRRVEDRRELVGALRDLEQEEGAVARPLRPFQADRRRKRAARPASRERTRTVLTA